MRESPREATKTQYRQKSKTIAFLRNSGDVKADEASGVPDFIKFCNFYLNTLRTAVTITERIISLLPVKLRGPVEKNQSAEVDDQPAALRYVSKTILNF
ncbi:unnamed protein product [Rangifer tarandus platyrhynchus]|uniref:Uncharacterized protein n=1 Tax=Rangifer tarandus platyrhynchus TaxID=3082113 RepID=A0AC59ZP95_RANTA